MDLPVGASSYEGSLRITLSPRAGSVGVSVTVQPAVATPIVLAVPRQVATTLLFDFSSVDDVAIVAAGAERVNTEIPGLGQLAGLELEIGEDGQATIAYEVPVTDATAPRRRGPSYDLRGSERGFAAALMGFVALPWLTSGLWDVELTWDLAAGASGTSTRGLGARAWQSTAFDIATTFVAGGQLQHWEHGGGFTATWFEQQEYDTDEAFGFADAVLTELQRLFEPGVQRPYHLIIRPSSIFRDGGAATTGGFMLETGRNAPTRYGRMFMFAHEIAHHFAATLHGDLSTVAWYSEGLAEFYKIEIPRRLKLCDAQTLATEINTMTLAYAGNLANRRPATEIAGGHWNDNWVQGLPYNRGFHYFVGLDALLRASGTTVDDLVRDVNERRARGDVLGNDTWRSMLATLDEAYAGGLGLVAHFDAMLAGELMTLPSDAFGPELECVQVPLERRWIGFNDMTLTPLPASISGVGLDSAAAHAGLVDGDVVVAYRGATHSNLHSSPGLILDETVTLSVERDGEPIELTYSTVIDTVDAWVWREVAPGT